MLEETPDVKCYATRPWIPRPGKKRGFPSLFLRRSGLHLTE